MSIVLTKHVSLTADCFQDRRGLVGYPNAEPTPEAELPPARPYLSRYALQSVIDTRNEPIAALDLAQAENEIANVKAALLLARETIQKKIDALQEV
jgi:hypothetical protein